MKQLNRTISGILAVSLIFSSSMTAFASEAQSKEEVIYVMTDANGHTKNVYAVSICGKGDVTDYGDYSNVKLLNTNDDIHFNRGNVTFRTEADKAYLQGDMTNTEIPWDIEIKFILDGKEISAEELAGKSGALEIHFTVSENEHYSDFYENYALQASFTLDTALCDTIFADDATIANVGRKKQLTYTILPGKGIDTRITANVHDFEMDSVSINGIRLNLNIDVDTSELTEKVTELQDGISQLDDGANDLKDGSEELNDGEKELSDGAEELKEGAGNLEDGAVKLTNGTKSVYDATVTLKDGAGSLYDGAEKLESGASSLASGAGSLNDGMQTLKNGSYNLSDGTETLSAGAIKLKDGSDSL